MNLEQVVKSVGTFTELKRVASAYVIDHKALKEDEIRAALLKTAPQYCHPPNVQKAIDSLFFSDSRDCRILSKLILRYVVLNQDEFMCRKRHTDDEVVKWEQTVIDRSNEELAKKSSVWHKDLESLRFLVETAWQNDDLISRDEANLIDKVRTRLRIREKELRIIEARLGKFPKPGNHVHIREEVEAIRRMLQSAGLLFTIRDKDGKGYDVIPDEVAQAVRQVLGVEIRTSGYHKLLKVKYVGSKPYLTDVLKKCSIPVEKYSSLDDLKDLLLDLVSPSVVLGGLSPKDGLPMKVLQKWCGDLHLNMYGAKAELIARIIGFYDQLRDGAVDGGEDKRDVFYKYFEALASRKLDELHSQNIIKKDLDVEHEFEQATDYLFEKKLGYKPLTMAGTAHPDGALSYQDKMFFWDNKSKETPVKLREHIKQFDGYIKSSEKTVACFLVIGPDFDPDSGAVALKYQVDNGVTITLITAQQLKAIADAWAAKEDTRTESQFPLGYLIQPGRINLELLLSLL